MSRALVAIGVSKAPGLRPLPGAAQDAREMAAWATSQGYESIRLLVDDQNAPVTRQGISDVIATLLADGALSNLVIYFSGHGYAPFPGQELWLLSNWQADGNEAVQVPLSVNYAESVEWPRVAFIGDACRDTWTGPPILGGLILPRPGNRPVPAKVDKFYATRFGFGSQETDGAASSFGVFTRELLSALKGAATVQRDSKRVVTSRSLATYLDRMVPEASATMPGAQVQHPDLTAQWEPDYDVYASYDAADPVIANESINFEALIRLQPSSVVRYAAQKIQLDAAADTTRFHAARGRLTFETQAGATVIGADVEAVLPRGPHQFFPENGAWHVRAPQGQPQVVLVGLKRPESATLRSLAVPIYPGLVATAIVDADGCWSMNYLPALTAVPNGVVPHESLEAFRVVAETSASLKQGRLPSHSQLAHLVDILRRDSFRNPALAVLTANLCHRLGAYGTLYDLVTADVAIPDSVPYDWSVLAGIDRTLHRRRAVVGTFPWMSFTWATVAAADPPVPDRLLALSTRLQNSLWTMVGADDVNRFLQIEPLPQGI